MSAPARARQEGPPEAAVRAQQSGPVVVALVLGSIALGCAVATQVMAANLGFHPALGAPVFAPSPGQMMVLKVGAGVAVALAGLAAWTWASWKALAPGLAAGALMGAASLGPVYAPTDGIGWALRLARNPEFARIAQRGAVAGTATAGAALLVGVLAKPKRQPHAPSGAFGTAKFGDPEPYKSVPGPIIGRHGGELLHYPGDGHLISFSPTGGGKGIGSVVPNCLTYPGSLVVTDPKGENAAISFGVREKMGQNVRWLDPWKVLSSVQGPTGDDGFNPIDFIEDKGPDANDDAWMIGEQLIPPTYAGASDGHWLDQARAFLSGLILHVATTVPPGDENRSLPYVRDLICLDDTKFNELLDKMAANNAAGGGVARVATLFRRIMQRSEKEFGSIMSTVARHTWFLDSPRIRECMVRSSFKMDDLKAGKLSLFVSVPPHRLDTYGAWQRTVLACAIAATSRVVGKPKHKVLAIIDEAGNMGTLPELPRAVTLSRGAGLTVWAIFQDISQPKALYNTRWSTFFSNADVLQTFGTNDHETAVLLSSMAGEETIVVESSNASVNSNRGRGGAGSSRGSGVTAQERARKLLMPDEVRRLESNQQLLFLRNRDPLLVERVNYLRDPEFANLGFAPNPTYRPVGGEHPQAAPGAGGAAPQEAPSGAPSGAADGEPLVGRGQA